MTHIATAAYDRLVRGESVVLAKIITRQGSTPRTAGTQMIVAGNGQSVGTIGGGLLEARVNAQCTELLSGDGSARLQRFDLGHDEIAGMDMICGGGLEILLDPFLPSPEHIDLFDRWSRMAAEGRAGVFVFTIRRADGLIERIDHALIEPDGRVHGRLPLTAAAISSVVHAGRTAEAMRTLQLEDVDVILEPIRPPDTAFVVGAGHVAQPTAHVAALAGFRVVVMDDRASFASRERFPDAHAVRVLPDFEDSFAGWTVGRTDVIIIITRGHLFDKVVLARALQTQAGYIGMIGSRRKRDAIFKRLIAEGFTRDDLKRVHSPVGLDIGAETPAEIAVSIVAEMIAAKRKGVNRRSEGA